MMFLTSDHTPVLFIIAGSCVKFGFKSRIRGNGQFFIRLLFTLHFAVALSSF